jgi:hypothetical protein
MTTEELRNIAIDSAEVYFNYLKGNNKGIAVVPMHSITRIDDSMFSLKLSNKLYDTDSVYFENKNWM